jgi:DNA-binding NtrC family response regulator
MKHVIQLDQNNVRYDDGEATRTDGKRYEMAVALRRGKKRVVQVPGGLMVSSDDDVRRNLARVLRQCALAPVLASTVAESQVALAGDEILDDGKSEDIVKLAVRSETKAPVIVVSQRGDWPEYLTAMCAGAFDYLAYPPIPGDLLQTIQNALLGRQRHLQENGEATWASNQ